MNITEKTVRHQLEESEIPNRSYPEEQYRVDIQLFSENWKRRRVYTVHPHFNCLWSDLPSEIARFIDDREARLNTFWITRITRTRPGDWLVLLDKERHTATA